jgi:ribosome-binding protein aMBF1 (putative translation factor)
VTLADRIIPRDAYYSTVGQAIRRERMARGWSQMRLASEIGVGSAACISYWEGGIHEPSAWMIDRLERLFSKAIRP